MRTIKKEDFERVWFDFEGDKIQSLEKMIIGQSIAIYSLKFKASTVKTFLITSAWGSIDLLNTPGLLNEFNKDRSKFAL